MNNVHHNEQNEPDALQSEADILRAPEVMSQDETKTQRESKSEKHSEGITARPSKKHTELHDGQIPRFDLAEDIMAEQRKITAIRRKAPGQKSEVEIHKQQSAPVGFVSEQHEKRLLQEEIIAEIVARDIENLCEGGNL